VNVVDLNAEAVLDPAICPGTAYLEQVAEPASILLTGATGFWEPFTHELPEQTKADIYCLVRSPNTEAGKIRLQKIWNPITFGISISVLELSQFWAIYLSLIVFHLSSFKGWPARLIASITMGLY